MAKVHIPFPSGYTLEFDSDNIEEFHAPHPIIDTGVNENGCVTRELGEHSHLILTFKRENRPLWVEGEAKK